MESKGWFWLTGWEHIIRSVKEGIIEAVPGQWEHVTCLYPSRSQREKEMMALFFSLFPFVQAGTPAQLIIWVRPPSSGLSAPYPDTVMLCSVNLPLNINYPTLPCVSPLPHSTRGTGSYIYLHIFGSEP